MAIPSSHKKDIPKRLKFALVTCSSSRYPLKKEMQEITDQSSDLAVKLLVTAGHQIITRKLIPDHLAMIRSFLMRTLQLKIDSIIFIGGSGVSCSDVTIEAVQPLLEKEIPGFGEIFRMISYSEIGSPAIMSRALAGVVNTKTVFCLPGSPDAVALALNKIIIPEIGHLSKLIKG